MTESESITQWIAGLKDGRESAAELLWQRYFGRITSLAKMRLATVGGPTADAEDVALSVFKSLCHGATLERFPRLVDRDNLWPLLVVMTSRKATDLARRENRQKRGGRVDTESGRIADNGVTPENFEELLSREPSPEMTAMIAETCDRLLGLLDPLSRQVAVAKLEGYRNREIAEKMGCGLRTVERKLHVIRRAWDESDL